MGIDQVRLRLFTLIDISKCHRFAMCNKIKFLVADESALSLCLDAGVCSGDLLASGTKFAYGEKLVFICRIDSGVV